MNIRSPDSTSPNPEIMVKIMKALVSIQTASPGPFIVPRPLVVVGTGPAVVNSIASSVAFKIVEFVGWVMRLQYQWNFKEKNKHET